MPKRPVARKSIVPSQPIRPFRTVVSPEKTVPERTKPKSQAKAKEPVTTTTTVSTTDTPAGKNESSDADMSAKTHFLLSISNQQGMAPIWIPYKKFTSTTAFLSHMLSECTLQYWDGQTKTLVDMQPERLQAVVAASVKFAWSNFEVRLRQGKDQDWALCMAQLEKAWKDSEVSMDCEFYDGFKVLVMLHVTG